MKKGFSRTVMSIPFLLGVPLLILTTSIVISIKFRDFSWIQRSGSIVTVFGILVTLRNNITQSFDEQFYTRTPYAVYAGGKDEMRDVKEKVKKEITIERIGLAMTICGTIIWGYGDLIGKIIK